MESTSGNTKHKVVFVGNISVGKTSILNRYVHGSFVEEYQPTVGIDFVTKSIPLPEKASTLMLQLWDTAGQERFHSVIPIYIKDSSAAVVIYDITDTKSFNSVQKWVEDIKQIRQENSDIFLVGNKVDLNESRKVTKEEAEAKAKSLGLKGYFEASAKTGDGIAPLFDQIVKMLSEKLPDVIVETKQKVHIEEKPPTKKAGCKC